MIFVLHILVNFTPQKRMNHDEKKRIVWDHSMSLSVARCPLITIFCVTPLTAILLFCLSFLNGFPIKYNTVQVSFSTLKPQNWYLPQKSSIGRSQWINLDISVDGNEPNIKYSRPLKASVSLCIGSTHKYKHFLNCSSNRYQENCVSGHVLYHSILRRNTLITFITCICNIDLITCHC